MNHYFTIHKWALLIILILLLSGCFKNRYANGIYFSNFNGKDNPDFLQISLKKDNTFEFYGWSDILGREIIKGNWNHKKDTIFLNKYEELHYNLIKVEQEYDESIDGVKIMILDKLDRFILYGSTIWVNDDNESFLIDKSGYLLLKKGDIYKIKVKYFSTDSIEVNKSYNKYTILIDIMSRKLDYFYLSPKWILKGRKLIPLDKNNVRIPNQYYRRKILTLKRTP